MSYKFTNFLRSSELCECNLAALNWCIFRKNRVVCHQRVAKFLLSVAIALPILDCFIPKFKLKYDDLENINTELVNTVVFNLHQIKRFKFFGRHPVLGQLTVDKKVIKYLGLNQIVILPQSPHCPTVILHFPH